MAGSCPRSAAVATSRSMPATNTGLMARPTGASINELAKVRRSLRRHHRPAVPDFGLRRRWRRRRSSSRFNLPDDLAAGRRARLGRHTAIHGLGDRRRQHRRAMVGARGSRGRHHRRGGDLYRPAVSRHLARPGHQRAGFQQERRRNGHRRRTRHFSGGEPGNGLIDRRWDAAIHRERHR
jgi:hypothetical protein